MRKSTRFGKPARGPGGPRFTSRWNRVAITAKPRPARGAILEAGLKRIVIATTDPAPHVAGGGIRELREAGLEVEVGILEDAAAKLIAPFAMLFVQGRPFVHAKWAMTLDGKIASRSGHSQWISGPASRRIVHKLRGRMDAILVGAGTQRADDPRLTARPPGPRTPMRIVVDRLARTPLSSRLVQTLEEAPVLIAATEAADAQNVAALEQAGVEVLRLPMWENAMVDVSALLQELGQRKFTNVLVEGGERLLGSFFDAGLIDEVHVFIAPKLVSGLTSPTPMRGPGSGADSRNFSTRRSGNPNAGRGCLHPRAISQTPSRFRSDRPRSRSSQGLNSDA